MLRDRRRTTAAAAVALLGLVLVTLGACGRDEPPVPQGAPADVVRAAPAKTMAARAAEVFVALPTSTYEGRVDFDSFAGERGRWVKDAIELVGKASEVRGYGGQAIRSVSTLRAEFKVDGDDRWLDVWIDTEGRIRRVQWPIGLYEQPPVTVRGGNPALVTVDLVDFV